MKLHSKKIYCVGNAHLDPAWMWQWQEGSSEAKATIRSALDRMKEYPQFKFVCAGGQVFKWIEAFDPDMFAEIQARVKEGRFILVGGWFVQPDCNLPSGESFVRHGLYTQRYFMEKFGTTAKTGYNVDSFGHNLMLPQLLKKSGMTQYVFMRPRPNELTLPAPAFRWVSPDGSEVLASRLVNLYNSTPDLEDYTGFEAMLTDMEALAGDTTDQMFLFYGVGNHGGGPTKKNIETILKSRELHPESEFIFSDTEDYFQRLAQFYDRLPIWQEDLQHHASGCYSVVNQIKYLNRRAECELLAAETFGMLAKHLIGRATSDTKELERAWENVLFNQFHDIMGGCCLPEAYEDSASQLGESRSIAAKTQNTSLQSISWKINIPDLNKGIPLVLFNPHPFDVCTPVCFNKRQDHVCDEDGNELPMQHTYSHTEHTRFIPNDTLFMANIPAMGYRTYYVRRDVGNPSAEKAGPLTHWDVRPRDYLLPEDVPKAERVIRTGKYQRTVFDGFVLENGQLRVEIEGYTGHIKSIQDLRTGRQLLSGYGAIPVVIDEFAHDTWSHDLNYFDKEIGVFTDAQVTITENGPLRSTVKVTNRYNDSTLTQYFSLTSGSNQLQVRVKLDWQEKHKLLKLRYETALCDPKAYYEIPYGVIQRPADGEEEPGQMWIAAKDEQQGLAIINDSKYSFSVKGNAMDLTAVRSPFYLDSGRGRKDDTEAEYTDQGETRFRYCFMPLCGDGWSDVIQAAKLLNTPPTMVRETAHPGPLATSYRGIEVAQQNIMVSVIKRSEDNTGMILRAYETDGKDTQAHIAGDLLPMALNTHFTPYSVNTYYLPDGESQWQQVMLTEFPID